jgi:hypothetical protein
LTRLLVINIRSSSAVGVAYPKEAAATRYPLKEAFFGETHVHTGVSMDAFIGGNRLTPDGAYRFAKGEEVMANGQMHRIKKLPMRSFWTRRLRPGGHLNRRVIQ